MDVSNGVIKRMKQSVELLVKISFEVDADTARFVATLPAKLASRLDDMIARVSEPIRIVSIRDSSDKVISASIDREITLAAEYQIAVVWSIGQVLQLRPDLSVEQAWQVLLYAQATHSPQFGINEDILVTIAEQLFGMRPFILDQLAA